MTETWVGWATKIKVSKTDDFTGYTLAEVLGNMTHPDGREAIISKDVVTGMHFTVECKGGYRVEFSMPQVLQRMAEIAFDGPPEDRGETETCPPTSPDASTT